MADDIAIKVSNVSKTFILPHEKHTSLKSAFINFYKRKKGYEKQQVLNNVSFEVKKGEFFGIVGRNGSGKSTLLKLISGIYTPDTGSIEINGKLVPFIELGVGFNPELTGRENVFLNGALLGFSRKEMEAMYDEIVEFAELERFMDQKLKNYSSGMQVRLAFSIAIRAKADTLVLDEVLAVGDEAFQRKCYQYFEKLKKDKKTVVLVTHDMGSVRQYCDRAILVHNGSIVVSGSPDMVADKYSLENIQNSSSIKKPVKNEKKAKISAKIIGSPVLDNTETLRVEVRYQHINNSPVYPKVVINYNNVPVMAANAKVLYNIVTRDTKEHIVIYELPLDKFNKGEAHIVALLVDSDKEVNLADFGYNNELPFIVRNPETGDKIGGIMKDLGKLELKK